jgi:hypothetical protein
MAKSIALATEASRLASLLLSYIPAVCAFVAPRQPGASTATIDRLSHSRALSCPSAPSGVQSAETRPRLCFFCACTRLLATRAAFLARLGLVLRRRLGVRVTANKSSASF